MTLSTPLLVGLVVTLFIVFAVLAAVRSARIISSSARRPTGSSVPASSSSPSGERLASTSSEAIEELVNQALVKAGVNGVRVDFATAHDGSLEIWIGDDRYTSVAAIPDPRVRQAVADAVTAFNR
ncbi:MAG TPA: hypothetical protein VLD63_05800 [Anaerolineales bacterium]|nr:hypothetical protein [Anaerolineales bacterium]